MRPNITPGNQAANPNAQTAVKLCYTASAADPVSDIEKVLPGWKIVWNGIQTVDANYAYIAVDPTGKNFGLTIRGSVPPFGSFSDWDVFANWVLEDLDVAVLRNWPYAQTTGARISEGAHIAFSNIMQMQDSLGSGKSIVDYLISDSVPEGANLIITGHSLGGNMANVFTSFFLSLGQRSLPSNNISLYTFAAPASGNSAFAIDLDRKLTNAWHYQNANDLVPDFPTFDGLVYSSLLYNPAPSAGAITTTYKGHTVSLREAFLLLAGVFSLYDYQQPTNNYTIFDTSLYSQYTTNTIGDWFKQAGSQHQIVNYANYLNVKLPVIALAVPVMQSV